MNGQEQELSGFRTISTIPMNPADRFEFFRAEEFERLQECEAADDGDGERRLWTYAGITAARKVAGRTGESEVDFWQRWNSFLGAADVVREGSGQDVAKWMAKQLTRSTWKHPLLPEAPVNRTGSPSAQSARDRLGRFLLDAEKFDEAVSQEEERANDVEEMRGCAEAVEASRKACAAMCQKVARIRADLEQDVADAECREDQERREKLVSRIAFPGEGFAGCLQHMREKPAILDVCGGPLPRWRKVTYRNVICWGTGHILDLLDTPHIKGWECHIDEANHIPEADRLVDRGEWVDMTPFAAMRGRPPVVYLRATDQLPGGDPLIVPVAQAYLSYFLSKYADQQMLSFEWNRESKVIRVLSGALPVGAIAQRFMEGDDEDALTLIADFSEAAAWQARK